MRKRTLFLSACVFLAGILFVRYRDPVLPGLLVIWLVYEWYRLACVQKRKMAAGRSIVLLSVFILGACNMAGHIAFQDRYLPELTNGEYVTVWGEIETLEPTQYGGVRFRLMDCYIRQKEATIPCRDILVYASSDSFRVGEIYQISGELNLFSGPRNDGGFDSCTYYQSMGIDFAVKAKESIRLEENKKHWKDALFHLRHQVGLVYRTHTSEATAGILMGMVLGDKSLLEEEIKTLFTNGGIAHILAISGLHVSILGKGIYDFLRKRGVGFLPAGLAGALLLFSYSVMVGGSVSTKRAVFMMLLFFGAQCLGRSYDLLNSLGAVCICLLWENPFLIYNTGFWFSVSALLGITVVGGNFAKAAPRKWLGGLFTNFGITLATLPVVAFCYYEIPLYSPFLNCLLLPLLTPIFVLAVLGGIVGIFRPLPAALLLAPCEWGLKLYTWVCELSQKLPFSVRIVGKPSSAVLVIYYLILLFGVWILMKKPSVMKVLLLMGICFFLIGMPKHHPEKIVFLDVGQGDGIYISTGEGQHYFIDGGSSDEAAVGRYRILPFLKSNGVSCIDYWFVSHADKDHISGLTEVLESNYPVKNLVISAYAPEEENLTGLLALAREKDVNICVMTAGDRLVTKSTVIRCIYPGAEIMNGQTGLGSTGNPADTDKNGLSLVFTYESDFFAGEKDFCAFFSGDISSEVETRLVQKGKIPSNVHLYKVAHHGSKYSNDDAILSVLRSKWAVISCSATNRYGHPHGETLKRLAELGCEVRITAQQGQITVK